MLLNQWVKKEITNYLETDENENITHQNLWDVAKAVSREMFTAIQAYLKKQEESQSEFIPKGTKKRTNKTKHTQHLSLIHI